MIRNDIYEEFDEPTDEELRLCERDLGDPGLIDFSAPAGISIDDPIQMYLKEIAQVPPLSAKEEEKLAARMAAGDEEAKNRMTEANLRLVVGIAKQYVDQGVLFQDLIQEGTLGLMKAVDQFDVQRGFRFSTYAAWWIRQAITQTIAEQAETVRISDHLVEATNRQNEVTRELRRELGREPTLAEIAGRMDMSVDEVQEIQKISEDAASLNTSAGEEENSQPRDAAQDEQEQAPAETPEQKVLQEQLNAVMTSLTDEEQQVLRMRYGLDDGRARSQEAVAAELGLDADAVGQIEADAMAKLQQSDPGSGFRGYVDDE